MGFCTLVGKDLGCQPRDREFKPPQNHQRIVGDNIVWKRRKETTSRVQIPLSNTNIVRKSVPSKGGSTYKA